MRFLIAFFLHDCPAHGARLLEACAEIKIKRLMVVALVLFACGVARAQDALPEKPHRVLDKKFIAATVFLAGAYAADMKSTSDGLHNCSNCFENGWFDHGGRNFPKIAAGEALFDAGLTVIAYEWKKRVRNKYLNPLWVAPFALQIDAHAQAAAFNTTNWGTPKTATSQILNLNRQSGAAETATSRRR